MNSSSSGKLKIPTLKLHRGSLENRKTKQLESQKFKQMETNRPQRLETVRALQIAAENKCVEFDFELQWSARGGRSWRRTCMPFSFFSFFFLAICLGGVFFSWILSNFVISKVWQFFWNAHFLFFQEIPIFFVATVRKLYRPEKKEAGLYRSKKVVIN